MTEQAGANVVGRLDQVAGRTNQNNIKYCEETLIMYDRRANELRRVVAHASGSMLG
jgi:hypothetical protein